MKAVSATAPPVPNNLAIARATIGDPPSTSNVALPFQQPVKRMSVTRSRYSLAS